MSKMMKKILLIITTPVLIIASVFAAMYVIPYSTVYVREDVSMIMQNSDGYGLLSSQDRFLTIDDESLNEVQALDFGNDNTDVLGTYTTVGTNLQYKIASIELPLYKVDYYYRKYENGRAGAMELNRMPTLTPGTKLGVIKNGFITLSASRGYLKPPGYFYASGVCWSTSTLGLLMDNANAEFNKAYGMSLFVFSGRDRAPHPHWYPTYHGRGYTIFKSRVNGQDYTFTVNPALKNHPILKDLQIKIVMTATNKNPNAYKGQSIGGYIMSNISLNANPRTNITPGQYGF